MKKSSRLLAAAVAAFLICASPAALSAEKRIKLTWLHSYQEAGLAAWADWVVKKCAELYPDITISLEKFNSDTVDQMVKTKIASDDPPAIFGGFSTEDYVSAGYTYDLANAPFISSVSKEAAAGGVLNGVQYMIPMDTNYYGVFYNKDVFKKYGISVPKTLDQLYAACEKLKKNGVAPFCAGFGDVWTLQEQFTNIYMPLCLAGVAGGKPDREWYKNKMNLSSKFAGDAAFKKAFAQLYALKKYFSADPMATDWATARNLMATGKGAMIANGSWTIDGVKSINKDANIGVFPMPVSNDPKDSVLIEQPGSGPFCFHFDDKDKMDATLKVFSVIYSKESGQQFAKLGNKISTIKGVDLSFNDSFAEINAYVRAGAVFSNAGIQQFDGEFYRILQTNLQKFLIKDKLDVDGFIKAMDSDFSATK